MEEIQKIEDETNSGFWPIFGCLQVYWGIKEMGKFKKCRRETSGEEIPLKNN